MDKTFPVVRPLDPSIQFWIRNVKNVVTIFSILAGIVTAVVIIKGSNRTNKQYSRLQLIVIFLSLLNDFIVQLVFSPHFLLPLPCVTRIDPLIPISGGVSIHYIVWIIIVAEQAPAYIACFAVLPPSSRWKTNRTAKHIFILFYAIVVLLPIPLLYSAILPHDEVYAYAQFLSPEWPSDQLDHTECSTFDRIQPFTNATVILHTTTVTIVVTLIIHTFYQLNKSLTISEKRRDNQRTMMRILILQSLLPIIVQVLPNVAGFTVFAFGWSGSAVYPVILLILSSNSLVLSIVVLGTTPLYRNILRTTIFGGPLLRLTQTTSMYPSSNEY